MQPSEIEGHIKTAYDIVKKANIQEEALQVQAFKFALGVNTPGHAQQAGPVNMGSGGQSSPDHAHQDGLAGIAKALDISYEVIELFYDVVDDELTLNLPPKALPDSASAAMREIAILLTVGRKHAGLGGTTSFDLIRTVCDDNGKLDKKNFAAAMNQMKPKLVPSGKGTVKDLVPKRPADDLAKELILKYNSVTG